MNNIFKKLIHCSCGKIFNFKSENGTPIYLCSRYKNEGKLACPRNAIKESDLLNIIKLHTNQEPKTNGDVREIVSHIDINGSLITIFYRDNTTSEWDCDKLKV